mgnify:CR=1 FL=1
MVGSVLVQRMREERDFDLIDPVFFSTSQTGVKAPEVGKSAPAVKDAKDLQALAACDKGAVDTQACGATGRGERQARDRCAVIGKTVNQTRQIGCQLG